MQISLIESGHIYAPEILVSQLATAGITTVIGLLGTDTSTRNLSSLHAKVCQL